MRKLQESRWIPLLMRCYRLSLMAYPASFRAHYANDMVQVFRDCSRDAYRQQQARGLFLLCLYTLTDLIITAGHERLSNFWSRSHVHGSTKMPYSITDSGYPFAERLAEVLEREPAYYALLIHMNASRAVSTVADSLALDGDPTDPATTYALFRELTHEPAESASAPWLSHMCNAARQHFRTTDPPPSDNMTAQLIHRIYADADLFEMIAAEEVGHGMIGVIESLALDGDVEDIEEMLVLMRELAQRA